MFNHASLALKLKAQNANCSTIDVQWFKSSFEVSFFIRSRLAKTSDSRQKEKQARILEKQTLNVTSGP